MAPLSLRILLVAGNGTSLHPGFPVEGAVLVTNPGSKDKAIKGALVE